MAMEQNGGPAAREEAASLIDTSKMSNGQRAALELTEAARETIRETTLASGLFMGSLKLGDTFPTQSLEDRDQGDAFLQKLRRCCGKKLMPTRLIAQAKFRNR